VCESTFRHLCICLCEEVLFFSPPLLVGLPLPPPLYSQSKMDSELSTRKFRVRSDSRLLPIRRDVVKEFKHHVSKFMFCPIELRVDDLLSEEFPQSLDQV